jgi:hypothetical protein
MIRIWISYAPGPNYLPDNDIYLQAGGYGANGRRFSGGIFGRVEWTLFELSETYLAVFYDPTNADFVHCHFYLEKRDPFGLWALGYCVNAAKHIDKNVRRYYEGLEAKGE